MKIRGTGIPRSMNGKYGSDEPQFAITKTTEWDVNTKNVHGLGKDEADERPEIQPRNVV